MSTQRMLGSDEPVMRAWKAYRESEEYANGARWAVKPEHMEGSLWGAFVAGFTAQPSTPAASEARDAETANEERDVLGERGLPRARHAGDRHRYERLAAAFYDETGMMAPGKDDPTGHHSYDERWEAWHRWTSERRVRQLAPSSPTPAPAPGEAERDPGYMTPEERAEFNAITRRLTYPVKIVRKEEWERIQSQLAAATRERDSARQVTDDYAAELARWRKIADTRGQHARGLVLRRREAEARAEAAERALAEAREEIRQLRLAGTMLSNVAFNLAQHDERPGQRPAATGYDDEAPAVADQPPAAIELPTWTRWQVTNEDAQARPWGALDGNARSGTEAR